MLCYDAMRRYCCCGTQIQNVEYIPTCYIHIAAYQRERYIYPKRHLLSLTSYLLILSFTRWNFVFMKCYVLLIPGFIHEPTGRSIPPIHTKMQLIQTDPSCLKHWLKPCKHLAMKKALKRRWDLSSSLPVLARVEPWPLSCGWRALAKAWTNSNLPMKVPPPFFWPQLLACFFGRAVAGTLPLCTHEIPAQAATKPT